MNLSKNALKITPYLIIAALIFTMGSANAQIIGKASTLLSDLATALKALGVVILTLALMWAGYKIMWQQMKIQEIAIPVIGGIIAGSASIIAGIIMG